MTRGLIPVDSPPHSGLRLLRHYFLYLFARNAGFRDHADHDFGGLRDERRLGVEHQAGHASKQMVRNSCFIDDLLRFGAVSRSPVVSRFACGARLVTLLPRTDFFEEAGHKPAVSGEEVFRSERRRRTTSRPDDL
jgi:hypothetical protein